MDEYQPPPAFGLQPNGPTHPYSHTYNESSAQSNDANHAMNASPAHTIPGLQIPPNSSLPSSFTPFTQLWQQLQDNRLVSLPSNSHPPNTGQPSFSIINPPGLNGSTAGHASTGQSTYEEQQEEDLGLTDKEEGQIDDAEDTGDGMARSESGEISEGEIVSDSVQEAANRQPKANVTAGKNSFFSQMPSISNKVQPVSLGTSQTLGLTSPRSSFHTMTNGRDSDRPAIPGLGAANPTPPKDDRDYEELCKDILRDLSNAGVTFSHFHANNHNNFYSDDDLRYLWSLWNEVGLPVSRQERIFYKALFSQNEIGPAAILAGITAGQQTLAGSSVVGAAASTHGQQLGEAHPSSILGPTTSTRSEPSSQPIVGSSVPRGALSNQSYRPAEPAAGSSAFPAAASLRESRPTPSAIGSVTAESAEAIRHEPPVPSASSAANGSTAENSRAAYLAKLQAARRPTATSNVPLSSHTETSVTTSPTTILTTSQAPNVSKASDSTINALIKQKLEAARMSAQQASALQSQTPQSQDAKRNAFVPASMIKVDVEPPLPTQIQPSPTLQHSPPSAPIRPATSTSNPQTPTTPIPGLFMSVPQPPSGNSYFYPRPPTIDHAQNGRPIATSARSESTLSVNFSAGQTWTPVHQERVVINLNETDDEGGDEMDLEVDEPIREVDQLTAETASDVVSRPLRQYNSDADSVAARGETRVREEQREQIATQLYQFASQTDLEKKLADMKAKLKAERAMKAALSAQLEVTSTPDLSAIKSRAPTVTTTIAPTQPSTTVFDVSAPVAQPSNNGLPAASVTSTLTETVVTAASSQQKKRPSEDPDASGEWRKKRRAEIQSDLQTRDQDLGSTAAKIAEVERQLALLHEEQQRQQEARAQLAMELEELGVDTEGMSHEEMQATKDDIEAAQQVVETADVRDVSMEDSHTQLAIITAEKAQEQDVSREISRPQSAGPIAETATSLVQAADDVAPHSASATAETSANSIPPAEEAAPRASPTSPNTLRQALQALGQGEPSTTSVPENAANGSPSDEDAMSLDSTGENDAEVDIAVSTTNQETELSTSETDGPQPADASTQPAVAVPAAENPGAYEPEVPAISSTSASSAQLEAVPSIHDGRILASRLATNAANPETARESSPERLLLADDPEASPLPLGRPQPREYVPYESPLTMFKAYRFHPEYSQKVTRGFRSLTYSHKIDPKGNPFCETELSQGVCNDPTCEFQHFGKVGLTGDKVLVQLGTDNPGTTEEQRKEWNTGLKELIKDLRGQNVKDPEIVARHIAEYRLRFLEEQVGEKFSVLKLGVR